MIYLLLFLNYEKNANNVLQIPISIFLNTL